PYAVAGAPLVPTNQKVDVEVNGTGFRTTVTISEGFVAGDWQVINHNGSAYALDVDMQGNWGMSATSISSVFSMSYKLQNYIDQKNWWAFYWALRYDDECDWRGNIYDKKERLDIFNLSAARE
ncbi:MAG: hypothetical protein L6Q76_25885, partial [Polyangiaceae bacterium]|nr:hypothetical protein [Polyangiaceae bacterium]